MSPSSTLYLALFVAFLSTVQGQILLPGSCADHSVVQNFSVGDYLGAWYEIENTYADNQIDGICVIANYSDFGNGSVRVFNTQINSQTGELQSALGSARPLDPTKNEAKLMVNFPFMGPLESPYWVLDTDYTGYSIVWSCRPAPDGVNSYQTYWFLSRTRTPSDITRGYVRGYLTALKFDLSYLEETLQTDCPN